uniref:VIT domain-containing protein n=1 Tax=Mycobacterium marinum TaxID=1781 RepID=UPI003561BCA3
MSVELLPLITSEPAAPAATGAPTCGELSAADGRRLPLKAVSVQTAVVGMTATSTVRQRFVNTGDTSIEATYVFPLPARAGVTDFVADLAGRRVVGVLEERGQAREDYEQALAAGQRAAIVEEDRPDVFSVRVGNLGPGEQATIEMCLTGPLAFEDGEATYRFPLVVAPRYTTGHPVGGDQTGSGVARDTDAVPDASRVTPPLLTDADERPDLQISLSVDGAGLPVSDLRASLPTAVLAPAADGLARLRVESGARADRDFVLRFRLDQGRLSSSALLVADAAGADATDAEEGTWSLTLVPPAEPSSAPRDVVVVLDRSGSMGGWKMVAARRAAGRIVDMLDAGDRFCVLAFDDRIETPPAMPDGLVPASDRNRFAASSWLGSLRSRGGTVMAQPLTNAVEMLADSGEDRQASVVLVTDGQISGEDHLLRSLAPVVGRTRIYCVGVDRAVNAGFLERLAGLGSGRAELVESEDRLDEVMARLARTIGADLDQGARRRIRGHRGHRHPRPGSRRLRRRAVRDLRALSRARRRRRAARGSRRGHRSLHRDGARQAGDGCPCGTDDLGSFGGPRSGGRLRLRSRHRRSGTAAGRALHPVRGVVAVHRVRGHRPRTDRGRADRRGHAARRAAVRVGAGHWRLRRGGRRRCPRRGCRPADGLAGRRPDAHRGVCSGALAAGSAAAGGDGHR